MGSEDTTFGADDRLGDKYDAEIIVETARTWQEIDCPLCESTWEDLIREDSTGHNCSECGGKIRYTWRDELRSNGEQGDDHEQRQLFSDGGVAVEAAESDPREASEAHQEPPAIDGDMEIDKQTHYAHVRYAAGDTPGVIWYDPRNGQERLALAVDTSRDALEPGEQVLTTIGIYCKHHRAQAVDPDAEWVLDRYYTYKEEIECVDGSTETRVSGCRSAETHESLTAAREAASEKHQEYTEAPYKNALDERVDRGDAASSEDREAGAGGDGEEVVDDEGADQADQESTSEPASESPATPARPHGINRQRMAMDTFNNMLRFEGSDTGVTTHAMIIRDEPGLLVTASRSKNADSEWEVRGFKVRAPDVKFKCGSRKQANVATIIVETFDGENLTIDNEYVQRTPVSTGIPTVVAADGKPAVAAYRHVQGDDHDKIGGKLGVSTATVSEYLSRFRNCGVGLPDDIEIPAVGDIVDVVPPRFDP